MKRLIWDKDCRLLRRPQFQACYDEGKKLFTRHFVLFIKPRTDEKNGVRLGLTVSRKVGCAVIRNRVKRVLREYFRLHRDQIDAPLDIVIVPKRNLDPQGLTLCSAEQELSPVIFRYRDKALPKPVCS